MILVLKSTFSRCRCLVKLKKLRFIFQFVLIFCVELKLKNEQHKLNENHCCNYAQTALKAEKLALDLHSKDLEMKNKNGH